MNKNKKRNDMNGEKVTDLLWEVKEGKKHPNKAYKELCVLFDVSTRLINSLGDCVKDNDYEIIAEDNGFWINHKIVGSGEPLKQWIESTINER